MARTSIFNPAGLAAVTLPLPYGNILGPGTGIIVADSVVTAITNIGGSAGLAASGLIVSDTGYSSNPLSTLLGSSGFVAQVAALTSAAPAIFPAGTLALYNADASFKGTLATTGITANRTYTFPNASVTLASAAASTSSTAANSSAFTGTGQTSAGQVITTTDNQTMTLNQCAGMWFISATHGPYYIVSNTAVTGAPAVLTVIGDAPTTDAGAYRIVTTAHLHTQA